jgi:hypothetical protein
MRITTKIPTLTLAVSLTAGTMLLAAASGADAMSSGSHKVSKEGARSNIVEISREGNRDRDHDRDRHRDRKKKWKDKDRNKNKCGGRKKCPTPKPVIGPIQGGNPPRTPGTPGGPTGGNTGGAPSLGDPGYSGPPAGGSSGGSSGSGGSGSGGPSGNPIQNGGSTIKQN